MQLRGDRDGDEGSRTSVIEMEPPINRSKTVEQDIEESNDTCALSPTGVVLQRWNKPRINMFRQVEHHLPLL